MLWDIHKIYCTELILLLVRSSQWTLFLQLEYLIFIEGLFHVSIQGSFRKIISIPTISLRRLYFPNVHVSNSELTKVITWGHSINVNLDPGKFNCKIWHLVSTFLSCDGVGAALSGNQPKGFLWASRFRHWMNPWMKWTHGFHCKHTRVNYLFTDSLIPQLKILYWKPALKVSGSQIYSGEQDKNGHCPQRQHSRGEGKAQTTNTWVIADEKCSLGM